MVDITQKSNSLRIAIATATVTVSKPDTIEAIEQRKVPKGDVFEFSRAAGLFGVKRTSDMIPDCHPLPVEYTSITHRIEGLNIIITVEVHTIYKTGVEVEAMHGASITALTMYDMLKPIDKQVEIQSIRLVKKSGGKSDFKVADYEHIKAAVIVCSDSISAGNGEDVSGRTIISNLDQFGIETLKYEVISDEFERIQSIARSLPAEGIKLLIFTGGTGLSPRDVTVDAIKPLIEKPIDGLMETSRRYGQDRMPFAMLSRGVAGLIGETLVLTFPGSVKGVKESMDALFPQVLHVFKVMQGSRH
ncbi:bifunctional molybdenum cofactor biosynthesis protein MoaC/MoaB [Mucilaginibacter achroorhodeus]|uniref:Molybdopterin adenylyltransferase n=1 Tax=Mucilaginibacter achroorhodeus TaxID=2599294 RepID=A0A563TXV7_9SPHI|nr:MULTISPECIES: bifunctional molybdenum cofactor biosynthesis protein MoaC/MoaB [Mucilaginibacter]QXV65960.1 bifunctional molybdenum cofactor biosynthesis protein MoaC/MoaB [Mucilaginibacter sp. 21P]TWR24174.1 bifunctional molybdenum cofactor biosynthesis protein MoaC/MoaB [Mucilaginibacter achroorhodeus]